MIKAVIFDLFETLITEFDSNWTPPKPSMAERLGIPEAEFLPRFKQLDDNWQIGRFDGFGELLTTLCNETGNKVPVSVINDLVQERRTRLSRLFENVDDSIVEMIQRIKSMEVHVAVVSNASNTDVDGWLSSRLGDEVGHFITSYEVGVLKPSPLIYNRALDVLEVEAIETVWVGDGSYDELAGAQNVGMIPLWASWFLDRWPPGIRPGTPFEGDQWRQDPEIQGPFPRMETTDELLKWLDAVQIQPTLAPRPEGIRHPPPS